MGRLAIAVALFLAVLKRSAAQDATATYPVWVTNDYNCVIQCIAGQLDSATPPATQDQTDAALGCVRDTCSSDTAAGNIYQAHYIINMFNAIGSIYEPQSWQDGNAPDASDLSAPSGWEQVATTTAWEQDGQSTTVTTSVWVPASTTAQSATLEEAAVDTTSTASGSSGSSAKTSSVSAHSSASSNGTSSNGTTNGTADSSAQHPVGLAVGAQVLVAAGAILGASLIGALRVVV